MADSIDPILTSNTWVEVYTETGISVGTALWLYNSGNNLIEYSIKATEPTTELGGGIPIREYIKVDAGETGLWVRSTGPSLMTVQETI